MAGDLAGRVLSLFSMRATTFTVDGELADRIERLSKEKAMSFEKAANEALREGLALLAGSSAEGAAPVSYTRPVSLGGCLLKNLDDVTGAITAAEGEGFR
ncbi:MAG TPA: hypothetical protein VJ885_11805 [Thermoanaerobaculia bacterium]|nr:hypothetical protein [Thermoanaerobaculia bacterium]